MSVAWAAPAPAVSASSFTAASARDLQPVHRCSPRIARHAARALRSAPARRMAVTAAAADRLAVMVNGVPGRMAAATAEEVVRRGLILADEALTGPGVESSTVEIGTQAVTLALPEQHEACLQRVKDKYPRIVVVDYTHPSACNPNVERYAAAGLSFVVGTTGGDVDAMHRAVDRSPNVYAVVAPNMGKQIVAFQATMDMMAREFPGAFAGYSMKVTESHQSTKADTSGTAKAVVASFQQLGVDFDVDDIVKVRTPPESMEKMKVPGKFVTTGHAFHTYQLASPDGTVTFEFQHNVCGRAVYAAGTVDAVRFVDARRQEGSDKRVFNMIDILRSGSMR
jgi:4-hydroxy-tetrahydrodipicolinate reductase